MRTRNSIASNAGGFSLIELVIAMTVTLVIMGIASTLLARAFKVRKHEDQKADALADVQRAINIMEHEIANAGYNLTTNGIVNSDSAVDANGNGTIRVRANLNKYDSTASQAARDGIGVAGADAGEDVKFFVSPSATTSYLVRYDAYSGNQATVLANRIDSLSIQYYDEKVTYTTGTCQAPISDVKNAAGVTEDQVTPSLAKYVVIAVCVGLEASGTPNSPGYVSASRVLLATDVALRNSIGSKY
jgi:Tfp pilus assembly protein PilW